MSTGLSLTSPTFTDTTVPGAADLNRFAGNDAFFAKVPYVRATRTVDQEISNATVSPIRFNTPEIDAEGTWQGSGTASHADFAVKMTGYYQLTANITWNYVAGATGLRSLRIQTTAGSVLGRVDVPPHLGNVGVGQSLTCEAYLAVGAVVNVVAYHTQGAVISVAGGSSFSPVFTMRFVRVSTP